MSDHSDGGMSCQMQILISLPPPRARRRPLPVSSGDRASDQLPTSSPRQILKLHPDNSMITFAGNTYLTIPASGVDTCSAEIDSITTWATMNNLTLHMAKTTVIIIYDSKRTAAVATTAARHNLSRHTPRLRHDPDSLQTLRMLSPITTTWLMPACIWQEHYIYGTCQKWM